MTTTSVVISGALGKMGIEIANIALSDATVVLAAALERPGHPSIGKDYGTCLGKGSLGCLVTDKLSVKSTVIDFSSSQSTQALLEKAVALGCPMVIGTTGLSEADYSCARSSAATIPILVSPNMSLGVNLLFSITEFVASRLKNDFDIEIIEAHHRFKKDSPSGTAKQLGEIVAASYELPYNDVIKNGRAGMVAGDRPKREVGMHAVRGGDIVGDHTVLFAGLGERIELRHMMHSRSTLARGAVVAAKWLANQAPGYYSMRDVLGL